MPWLINKKAARKLAEMFIRAYYRKCDAKLHDFFHKRDMLGRGARDFKLLCNNLLQVFHFCEDSFMNKNDPRYNHKMGPVIWKGQWRKGSQVCLAQHLATLKEISPVQWHHKIGSFMTCSHLMLWSEYLNRV